MINEAANHICLTFVLNLQFWFCEVSYRKTFTNLNNVISSYTTYNNVYVVVYFTTHGRMDLLDHCWQNSLFLIKRHVI